MSVFACTAGIAALLWVTLMCAIGAANEADRADRNSWIAGLLCAVAIVAIVAAMELLVTARELVLK